MTAGGADYEMFREVPDEQPEPLCPKCDSVEWFPGAACFHCGWEGSAAEAYEFTRVMLRRAQALLHRVVIAGGAGSWTAEERDCWACDLKDFQNGHLRLFEASHENCHHAGGGNDYRRAKEPTP